MVHDADEILTYAKQLKGWDGLMTPASLAEISHAISMIKGDSFFPEPKEVFRAFEICPVSQVKIVIFGQDPYHSKENGIPHACGLSFSTRRGMKIPPSLQNIYKEMIRGYNHLPTLISELKTKAETTEKKKERESLLEDIKAYESDLQTITLPNHGDLTELARQGVLFCNTTLTVRESEAGSHSGKWQGFIKNLIEFLTEKNPQTIYLLWGKDAASIDLPEATKKYCLVSSHPSPFSANRSSRDTVAFIGSNHFVEANRMLFRQGKQPIRWQV